MARCKRGAEFHTSKQKKKTTKTASLETATAVRCKLWHQIPHFLEVRTFRGKSNLMKFSNLHSSKWTNPSLFPCDIFHRKFIRPTPDSVQLRSALRPPNPLWGWCSPKRFVVDISSQELPNQPDKKTRFCRAVLDLKQIWSTEPDSNKTSVENSDNWMLALATWKTMYTFTSRTVPTMPPATTPGMQDVPPDINMDANASDKKVHAYIYCVCVYIDIHLCVLYFLYAHIYSNLFVLDRELKKNCPTQSCQVQDFPWLLGRPPLLLHLRKKKRKADFNRKKKKHNELKNITSKFAFNKKTLCFV